VIFVAAVLGSAIGVSLGQPLKFEALIPVAYFAYHAAFLYLWAGQSPGRRTFDITVVPARGGELRAWQALARSLARPLFILAAAAPMLDSISFSTAAQIAFVVALLEIGLLYTLASRRTAADLVSGTLVVNTPPLQPHRAPAAPMYSATDAEFGYPPRRPKDGK